MSLEQLQYHEQTQAEQRIVEPEQESSTFGTTISGGKTPDRATVKVVSTLSSIAGDTVDPKAAGLWEHMRDFRRSAAFPAWVALGLIAASVGVSLLELIANLFGKMRLSAWPGLTAIMLYLLLAAVQPRLFAWPRRRVLYLATIFLLTFTLASFLPLPLRPVWFIAVYGIVAHSCVAFKKRDSMQLEAAVAAGILLGMIVSGGAMLGTLGLLPLHYLPHTLLKLAVQDGLSPDKASVALEFAVWLVGLVFVHTFTRLGVQERAARLRSDTLVSELTVAQTQLRTYALRAEELATMRERERVAREIHDTLAQGLAAIKMHLETGARVFHEQPDLSYRHMQRASSLASEYLRETRASILQLRADALDGQSLPAALSTLAAAWQPGEAEADRESAADTGAAFRLDGISADDALWRTLAPSLELACYRVAQEALTNARKHGRARHAEIELSVESGELCLTVTDDGGGFDTERAPCCTANTGGFGLTGMRERVKLLNGRLDVISAPGAGTQIAAMLPVNTP